ncbi:MAG: NAD(P)-dependent oxidoreductase [Pseudomonadota bacterium]
MIDSEGVEQLQAQCRRRGHFCVSDCVPAAQAGTVARAKDALSFRRAKRDSGGSTPAREHLHGTARTTTRETRMESDAAMQEMASIDDRVIGFIGLGNMGVPMCRNLCAAGFSVIAYDTRTEARAAAEEAHDAIRGVASLADLGAACRRVILMVPDSRVVSRVVSGTAPDADADTDAETAASGTDTSIAFTADGLAAHLADGAIIADMSSSVPPSTVALGSALRARGITLVDAPVSGGVAKAVTGELAIMAGGEADAITAMMPAFDAMGRTFRTGALGSGHATKALNNYLSASSLIATAEALIIGRAFGLDPSAMNAVFKNSTGRSNTTDVKVDRYFIPEDYASGFALGLLDKDVGMARDMAAALGLDARFLQQASALLGEGVIARGDADHTEMYAYLSDRLRNTLG